MAYPTIKIKIFISHHKGNQPEVDQFIQTSGTEQNVLIPYVLNAAEMNDFINSTNPSYVIQQIRKKYL